ncbi:bifunctional 4-hydroxy-2-oxoglutarate aldolase/2-dehydro-3-deoxy-phosphogluconate aldolase [Mycolicibacterium sp. 22603]|uniref:bifunctional 4-hydroxy-2-oxoglutarate aldolase/2-dehydro-3-deoxy-phosphogluconate aldolase n=1 Tax=Mycolicibacterium sp. 22603 TaxID=3453950 RepID=UPI003F86BC76
MPTPAGHPLLDHPVIPLATVRAEDHIDAIGDGLVAAGLPVVEVALRGPHGIPAIRRLAARGDLLVGAGTVLTSEQADEALDAGAGFIVAPGLDIEVVQRVTAAGCPVIPGVLSPTEVAAAARLGLTHLKLFPASAVDARVMLGAYADVFPDIRFMPSSGVNQHSIGEFARLPSVFAVSGSWITAAAEAGAAAVTEAARAALAACQTADLPR